jgi:hydrogenase maturation protease
MASRILILGIGSPFGDDRLGWVALEALQASAALAAAGGGSISFAVLDRPGPSLLAQWHGADLVIVVDAMCSGAPPGTRHRLEPAEGTTLESVSSHGFGLAAALELARALNELPPHLVVYGMEIDPSCTGFSLSEPVRRSLPALIREIEREARARAQPAVI